ncbi:MAG: DUF58 domain-containing protein [Pseudomonadota bacterium]
MIVPQRRLLVSVGLVVLPLAAIGGLVSGAAVPAGIVVAGLFLLVLVDAAAACRTLDGLEVESPGVVRLYKGREGEIEIRLRNSRPNNRPVRLGLSLPPHFQSSHEFLTARMNKMESLRLNWPCTAGRRGRYFLDRCYLESSSPAGFWSGRGARPLDTEIRVYPNLLNERKGLAAFFLNRNWYGLHAQRPVGKGKEFEKLRDYAPGDSYEDIYWKTTAKRGRPVTKLFQIERTQEVYLVIDGSRLSAKPISLIATGKGTNLHQPETGAGETVLERFITATLIMALAAQKQGDHFGIVSFADRVDHFVRAGNGRNHFSTCRDILFTLEPQIVAPDFGDLFSFIGTRMRRRALLIILTSLDDPALSEDFVRNIDLICRRHVVLVNMLRPRFARPLFSGPDVNSLDDLYRSLGGHIQWSELQERERVLRKRGVGLTLLDNERMCPELVSKYMEVKQRQIL